MTASYAGIEFPYSVHHDGPPCWPYTDPVTKQSVGPGSTWWTCDLCGGEVHREPNGGDGYYIEKIRAQMPGHFRFHWEMCPARRAPAPKETRE